jgi:transposase
MRHRKQYSRDFKLEALRLVESSGKSVAEIERDLGITTGLLYKWRQRYQVGAQANGQAVLEPSEHEAAQAEIRRLKRELEVVKQERDILEKAVAIFSQDQETDTASSLGSERNSR